MEGVGGVECCVVEYWSEVETRERKIKNARLNLMGFREKNVRYYQWRDNTTR